MNIQDKVQVNLTSSQLRNSILEQSLFILSQDAILRISDSSIQNNQLRGYASLVSSVQQSYFVFQNILASSNSFQDGKFINQISNTKSADLLKNVTFFNNTAGESLLFLQYCVFEINNTTFLDTQSGLADIYLLEAEGIIFNSTFEAKQEFQFVSNLSQGSFVLATENSTLKINITTFTAALVSGQQIAIQIEVDSSLLAYNSYFCSHTESGKAIHSEESSLVMIQNSTFSTKSSASLYLLDVQNVTISDCSFNGSTKLIEVESSYFSLSNSSFQLLSIPESDSLISIKQSRGLNIEGNRFDSISMQSGGIITMQQCSQQSQILNNIFSNLRLITAAITLDSEGSMSVIGNQFQGVSIIRKGGALNIKTTPDPVIVQNNTFSYCSAQEGGAVFWEYYEPVDLLAKNLFENNSAVAYGNNVGSYPISLKLVKRISYQPQIDEEMGAIENMTSSGFTSDYLLILVDKYGQWAVTAGAESVLRLEFSYSAEKGLFQAKKVSNNLYPSFGNYNLSSLQLIAEPGSQLKLQASTSAINSTLPQVARGATGQYVLTIPVFMASCAAGNELLSDGSCVLCQKGYYLLTPSTSVISCKECPSTAECPGGSNLHPLAGFWRETADSDKIFNCYNAAACTGSQSEPYDPEALCYPGYRGVLCAQCEVDYVGNSSFQCAKCPDIWWNSILLSLILILSIIGVIFFLRLTMSSAKEQKSNISVFTKILMSHIQIIVLTASFDFDWPSEIHSLFQTAYPVANVSDRIISIDCFLSSQSRYFVTSARSSKTYIIFIFYLCLPLFLSSLSFLVWSIKLSCSRHARSKTITTLVILFFLFHPAVSDALFSLYNCREINSKLRLLDDLDIFCFQGSHSKFALIGIVGLLLWALGIPLGACLLLFRHRKSLSTPSTKEKYGFLYNGYRLQAYYWESVTMFRKLGMIFISVFLRSIGTIVQAFAVFLLLLAFVLVTTHKKPYRERELNDLEILSLMASCVSIYAGFFFLAAKSRTADTFNVNKDFVVTQEAKWILFLAVVLSNALFLFYWIVGFMGQIRDKIKAKYQGFYLCCCLCNRTSLLKEEERLDRVKEAASAVLDKIDDCERSMRSYQLLELAQVRRLIKRGKVKREIALEMTSELSSLFSTRDHLQLTRDVNQPGMRGEKAAMQRIEREMSQDKEDIDLEGMLNESQGSMTLEYQEPPARKKSIVSRIRQYRSFSLRRMTMKEEEQSKASRRKQQIDEEIQEPSLAFLDEEVEYDCSFIEKQGE